MAVNARMAREYGEWKEQMRVQREADEYRRFLEVPDMRPEDIVKARRMKSDVAGCDGEVNVARDRTRPLDRERDSLQGKEGEGEREGRSDEIIQESV